MTTFSTIKVTFLADGKARADYTGKHASIQEAITAAEMTLNLRNWGMLFGRTINTEVKEEHF